jgi:hypothetical protein
MMKRSVRFFGAVSLISSVLLVAMVSLAGSSSGTSAAQGATVSLLPSSQNVQVGQSFAVDVSVENVTNMAAFEFRVKYDPDILTLEGITETGFISSTGRDAHCLVPSADPEASEPGNAWYGCGTTANPDSGAPVSGSAVIAHISFSARGPGLTYLTFIRLPELSDENGDDCCSPVSWNEASVRVIGSDESTPQDLPPTPTRNPSALTPTPVIGAPTPSTYLTPEPGSTPMTRTVDAARASGTSGSSGNSGSQGTSGGSPRAGEGPGKNDPAWWPPLLAGLLAAAGASLLPVGLYLRGASLKRRI